MYHIMQLPGWDTELFVAALVQVGFPGHAQQLQPPQVLGKRGEQRKHRKTSICIDIYIYICSPSPKIHTFVVQIYIYIYMSMYVCMDGLMAVYIASFPAAGPVAGLLLQELCCSAEASPSLRGSASTAPTSTSTTCASPCLLQCSCVLLGKLWVSPQVWSHRNDNLVDGGACRRADGWCFGALMGR